MNENENNIPIETLQPDVLIFEENKTYCMVGSTYEGTIELDLKLTKEKGTEKRHLSFQVVGFDKFHIDV